MTKSVWLSLEPFPLSETKGLHPASGRMKYFSSPNSAPISVGLSVDPEQDKRAVEFDYPDPEPSSEGVFAGVRVRYGKSSGRVRALIFSYAVSSSVEIVKRANQSLASYVRTLSPLLRAEPQEVEENARLVIEVMKSSMEKLVQSIATSAENGD